MASKANQKGKARVEKVASPVVEEEDPVSTSKLSPKTDSTTGPVDPERDAPLAVVPPFLHPELPPHQRVLNSTAQWAQLQDPYLHSIAQHGLQHGPGWKASIQYNQIPGLPPMVEFSS